MTSPVSYEFVNIRGLQANLSKENWIPAPLLERLVKEGKTLADVSRSRDA
jgi:hypothetical protein